jgi:hypothetical protein
MKRQNKWNTRSELLFQPNHSGGETVVLTEVLQKRFNPTQLDGVNRSDTQNTHTFFKKKFKKKNETKKIKKQIQKTNPLGGRKNSCFQMKIIQKVFSQLTN